MTIDGWGVAIQAGKIYRGWHVGAGATGELGPISLRMEAAQYFADGSPATVPVASFDPPLTPELTEVSASDLVVDSTSVVIGGGYRFPNSLTVQAEYFHNGEVDADGLLLSSLRASIGGALSVSADLVGVLTYYEFSPLMLGTLASIVSIDDRSFQIQPRASWSVGDEVEVLVGAILNFGERFEAGMMSPLPKSEYGSLPHVLYGEAKYYF